jgi:SAM-dependent methyltransferase
MPIARQLHEENRRSWNAATDAHNSHKRDQAGFLRDGGSTLFPDEIELLGELAGKSLVHLQCNAGQDTLSLARLGAVVTGVDISDTAIAFATQLSIDAGIPATFVRQDVYDWLAEAGTNAARYDIVFCSYGAICWLSDLTTWAQGIAAILHPDGRFVVIDFHPYAMTLDEHWQRAYPYFAGGAATRWDEGIGDYVAMSGEALAPSGYETGIEAFANPHPVHEFLWGIGEIVTALIEAGLRITALREYPHSNGAKLFDDMRELPGKRMVPPEGTPSLPMMYGIVAVR